MVMRLGGSFMYYATKFTDWGWLGSLGDKNGLAYIVLPKATEEAVYEKLQEQVDLGSLVENMPFFDALYREINNYFNREPFDFTQFPLQWERVTPYRRKVLTKTIEIPYGETRTYKWLAEGVGNPKGSRSTGQAMATNPWPIIIPCHRVVGSQGKLTGFGGGLEMKRRLLMLESDGAFVE